ncbi:unnamed protein product [Microthlaspi erraticum]|uniref:Methionine aminopeptidase n=1 Tax=Microthlaspi erraticum TaxID=1685480 RepID=A0A6D2L5K5_9BRAS|nr:unnamed protein product [Microthlaspi erraticum]
MSFIVFPLVPKLHRFVTFPNLEIKLPPTKRRRLRCHFHGSAFTSTVSLRPTSSVVRIRVRRNSSDFLFRFGFNSFQCCAFKALFCRYNPLTSAFFRFPQIRRLSSWFNHRPPARLIIMVSDMIIEAGAYPPPLGYGGFPKSVCTSVNECMCHGIPDSRQLQNGDIINIDVTVYLDGYHGDTLRTFFCGDVDEGFKKLVKVTEECLEKGIAVCKDGASFKKVGKRISEHAEKFGYNVVERFVGHGVGPVFHSEPLIYHHRNDEPGLMVEGQTFTIEPILTIGTTECVTWPDNWTTLTADGGVAAQFLYDSFYLLIFAQPTLRRESLSFSRLAKTRGLLRSGGGVSEKKK